MQQQDVLQTINDDVGMVELSPPWSELLPGQPEFLKFVLKLFLLTIGDVTASSVLIAFTDLIKFRPILQQLGIAKLDTPGIEWINTLVKVLPICAVMNSHKF